MDEQSSHPPSFSPIVAGARIFLREVRRSDVGPRYVRWMNDPDVTRYLESRYTPHSAESLQEYVRRLEGDSNQPFFAICRFEGREHIGNLKIGPIDWRHRRADVGLLIGERSCWGQGYATEAIDLAVRFAFETLSLNRLEAGCYQPNEASARAFEKCGFRREGLLRERSFLEGKPCDVILLGMTANDYRARQKNPL